MFKFEESRVIPIGEDSRDEGFLVSSANEGLRQADRSANEERFRLLEWTLKTERLGYGIHKYSADEGADLALDSASDGLRKAIVETPFVVEMEQRLRNKFEGFLFNLMKGTINGISEEKLDQPGSVLSEEFFVREFDKGDRVTYGLRPESAGAYVNYRFGRRKSPWLILRNRLEYNGADGVELRETAIIPLAPSWRIVVGAKFDTEEERAVSSARLEWVKLRNGPLQGGFSAGFEEIEGKPMAVARVNLKW
jgi:hypothetical protein